ncbi:MULTISPECIES: DUF1631 domain-containing protein [Xanthomonas]|nr:MULTISPECIES: DUF1631 domain-containing protein [Xanthomonas]MCW0387818.1 hypothetical protein [Xanthomonas sacchari]MDQ7760094.1 DUF1631 domain-containing protein [Xanthomonas sontii]TYD32843.1 hypothetical protein CEK63_16965 [Xanthomonas sontii]UZK06180.1 DUF1631 domain-containing protein [Xanthomonas sontii]
MPLSATMSAPPATLASAALPARVRDILLALNSLLWQALELPLQATLDELEQDLLEQAGRARNGQVQQDLFQEAQRVRAQRGRLAPFYQAQLEAGLAGIRSPLATAAAPRVAKAGAGQMLTLVADVDIDRDIVLHEIARREAIRCNIPLQLLGQRFGVLAARPAFEIEQLPLGPHALCRLLRTAGEALGLGLDTQLALYRAFERQVLARYGEMVERANVLLTHAGVLPGLIYLPYVARSTNVDPGTRRAARMPGAAVPPAAGSGPRGNASAPGQAAPAMGVPPGPAATAPLPPAGAAAGAAESAASGPDLATLRQLLTAARAKAVPAAAAPTTETAGAAALPARPASAAGAAPVPTASLLEALGELQAQPPAHSTLGGLRGRRHLRDVQTALLQALRATHGAQATLAAQQADTFDLLGLLYGEIEREVRPDAPAAALLERLQVPLVRAALQDPAFFARSRHPARELLNAVAESGATWLGEEDSDPTLLLKLNQAVDRVIEEYEGDETVFEQAHQEIQAQQRSLAHKAEIAERRHVEAARGKERLELAKQTATATLEALCSAQQPPGFVQTLLQQAWSDVLVLTLLRQGEDSETWRERIGLAERIAEVTCRSEGASDAALAERVGQALLQVGYHQQEAEAIARRLSTPGGTDATTSRTELSVRLKARTRLGEQGEDGERPSLPPRNEAEQAAYARLRTLPFGTWFEFVVNQQGDLKRQRLSWYSPITERALFVNQRGQKAAEHTLDGLARLLAQGQARIVSEDRARLIDRAWQAAVRALRTLAGVPAADDAMEGA